MAATIEVKYFNSYWLKKLKSIQPVKEHITTNIAGEIFTFTIGLSYFQLQIFTGQLPTWIAPGQKLTFTYSSINYEYTIIGAENTGTPNIYNIWVNKPITVAFVSNPPTTFVELKFSNIEDFNYVPGSLQDVDDLVRYNESSDQDWYIEESRIRGGYNNVSTDLGVKAYIVEESPSSQNRISSLIYSGIFNSRTGVNNTNQFSVAEDITRTLDPAQGSIQKLYSEDTNLIIFQEYKVSRALIDKDAIYTAEGQPLTASGLQVIGQIQSYAGNYGISTNPESFAVYGYRKYFTDRNKGLVLRLSQDGITEISAYGMVDYFRDNLSGLGQYGKAVGTWDMHNKQYVVSMQPYLANGAFRQGKTGYVAEYQTVAFDEDSLGWTSRFSFKPDTGFSMMNDYYTTAFGNIWKHYSYDVSYCNFYNTQYISSVTPVFNPDPSFSKTFQTINYEGTTGWAVTEVYTDSNIGVPISSASVAFDLTALQDQLFLNNFKQKENKYYGTILNDTIASGGTVVYGQSMSGIAGFYEVATLIFPDISQPGISYNNPAILFSVSSEFAPSLSR
jgi:hypothetical protein